MTEINEVAVSFFDAKTVAAFNRYSDLIEYVHISDRYSGSKSPEYVFTVYLKIKRVDWLDKRDLFLIPKFLYVRKTLSSFFSITVLLEIFSTFS